VKRTPGRPSKDDEDIQLVQFVRSAKERGLSIEQACDEFRDSNGSRVGTSQQLKRRYERVSREYFPLEPWGHPRLMALRKALGLRPEWTRRKKSAVSLLRGRPHTKPKA
jgi:hypothetical protein